MDQLAALDKELHSSVSELVRQAQEARAVGAPTQEHARMAGAEVHKRCRDLMSSLHERGLLSEEEAGTDAGGAGNLCLGGVVELVGGIVTRLLGERDEALRVASAFEAEAVKLSAANSELSAAASNRGTEQCPETTAAVAEEGGAAAEEEERARRTQENLERQLAAVRVCFLFFCTCMCARKSVPESAFACGCGWAQGHVCASVRLGSDQVCQRAAQRVYTFL